jgi:phosphatidylglycerophosphate synthase
VRQAESSRRTAEIEEISNLYFIHPLASRLVPVLARMGFTANAVSLTGMLFGAAAGVAYYHYQDPRWAITGFVLMLAWHVMDGADGQLARLTGSQSQFGQMVDGVADYVTFISVYAGLALALGRELGSRAYLLVAAAGLCHSVKAAVYEVQRREYDFWGWGRESARLTPRILPRDADASALHRLFDLLYRLNYIGLNFPAVGITVRFRKAMSAALGRPSITSGSRSWVSAPSWAGSSTGRIPVVGCFSRRSTRQRARRVEGDGSWVARRLTAAARRLIRRGG